MPVVVAFPTALTTTPVPVVPVLVICAPILIAFLAPDAITLPVADKLTPFAAVMVPPE